MGNGEAASKHNTSTSVAVEDVVRALLEKSVRQSVETDGALSAALSVSSLPTRNDLQAVTQAIVHAHNNSNTVSDSDTLVKQRPARPPPPKRVSSLCTEQTVSETSNSLYEDFEAGKAASLPRVTPININKKNRCKSVSFAPCASTNLRTFRKTAVIRRHPSPYYDAQHIFHEQALNSDSERYPVLPGDSNV